DDVVPGNNDHAVPPGFAPEGDGLLRDPRLPPEDVLRYESVRIDQHGPQRRITGTIQMEQQETGFGRDRHLHLFGDRKTGASLEVLLRNEDLREPQQPLPFGRGQVTGERNPSVKNGVPGGGDRVATKRDLRAPRDRDAPQQPRERYVPADE